MIRTIRLISSVAAILAGMTLLAVTAAPAREASAQAAPSCLPPTATNTPLPVGVIMQGNATPTATCTPAQIIRTATPTPTKTVPATNTPVPATEVPATNTPVPPPPTATSPSGGAGGAGVQPPNTGTGPAGSSSDVLPLVAAGMLLIAGTGSLALAMRKRR